MSRNDNSKKERRREVIPFTHASCLGPLGTCGEGFTCFTCMAEHRRNHTVHCIFWPSPFVMSSVCEREQGGR